ncbi:MAG: hypothetical protein CMH32_00860 [Micavibrio sp.]|nr:hypothetical protein [Micavibrio sp.]|tara:strand:- start:59 stop:379 length:321 start_codon:yes stop_codon:yes gene_type:complete
MSKSYLTGDEAQTFYNGPTRQKERIAKADKKRAAKADKARAEEARKLAEEYLATENKARTPAESIDGGALKDSGGKEPSATPAMSSPIEKKRHGRSFGGIGRSAGK